MPRTLRPILLAAVAGSVLTLAVVGLMSMSQVLPAGQHVIVNYGPHPRDMVQIRQGAPYSVPAGKRLVITGLGLTDNLGYSLLLVNGQQEATVYTSCSNGGGSTINALPSGLTAAAGSIVEASGGSGNARAWGYLADA